MFVMKQELTQYLVLDIDCETDSHETSLNYLYEAAEESSSSSSSSKSASSRSSSSESSEAKPKKKGSKKVGVWALEVLWQGAHTATFRTYRDPQISIYMYIHKFRSPFM